MSPAARATRAAAAAATAVAFAVLAAIALLPAAAATAVAAERSHVPPGGAAGALLRTAREIGGTNANDVAGGCVSEGRWHRAGAAVAVRDACLRCTCGAGALQCRRRACAATPAPPPRCHLRYRRDACCPELHCPEGITVLENDASARMEDDTDLSAPLLSAHVCVEEGAAWAAGSALAARVACETCFCLRGRRRCVRPRCLPPPPHCRAQPAPGACCPQRYYCDHNTTASTTPTLHNKHDCEVPGGWAREGARVAAAERDACTRCFCLRGAVRCQPPACSPPVRGCRPLLRAGDCCPHRYLCDHRNDTLSISLTDNALEPEQIEDRSFHSSRSSKIESTSTTTQSTNSMITKKSSKTTAATGDLLATTKVKRKTSDPPPAPATKQASPTTKQAPPTTKQAPPTTTLATTVAASPTTVATPSSTTELTTTDMVSDTTLTDQSDGSIKIMINGTINCTAELSSTALPSNATANETEKIIKESVGRVPAVSETSAAETRTSSPVEIITNGYVMDGLEDGDSFTINVTSSLNTNNNRSTIRTTDLPKLSTNSVDVLNISNKKTKGDYDYDYAEPTLPPSLPNLKIIPFVAADAVVDDDHPKESSYGSLEREDKFPVYFPSIDTKETFATKREDAIKPTQYPVFTPGKQLSAVYPPAGHDVGFSNNAYPSAENDVGDVFHEYTITASLGNRIPAHSKTSTKPTVPTSTFNVEAPAVNLFSPPVETEGGFIPKGPGGIIDEYFAVYPSTPPGPPLPHLTTSMQLDNTQGECLASNGRRVMDGESISVACSVCTCAWGEMHCSPRPCHTPAGCSRRPASINSADLCCGQLVCDHDNKTTANDAFTLLPSRNTEISLNESKIPESNITYIQKENVSISETNNGTASTRPSVNDSTDTLKSTTRDIFTTSTPIMTSDASTMIASAPNVTNVTTATRAPAQQPAPPPPPAAGTADNSTDYEDDDEDEGFSFGSVLKLLLSDSYDTTTTTTSRSITTSRSTYASSAASKPVPTKWQTTQATTTTTRRPAPVPTAEPFVPIPPRYPFSPPKITPHQTLVNRIDHLVLGEATAIKKPTTRPLTVIPPKTAFKPIQVTTTSTQKPTPYTRPNEIKDDRTTSIDAVKQPRPSSTESSAKSSPAAPQRAGAPGGGGGGLLKLAGCNIYGRMYGVGRVVAELSTACQECRCTDLGVQCRALAC